MTNQNIARLYDASISCCREEPTGNHSSVIEHLDFLQTKCSKIILLRVTPLFVWSILTEWCQCATYILTLLMTRTLTGNVTWSLTYSDIYSCIYFVVYSWHVFWHVLWHDICANIILKFAETNCVKHIVCLPMYSDISWHMFWQVVILSSIQRGSYTNPADSLWRTTSGRMKRRRQLGWHKI